MGMVGGRKGSGQLEMETKMGHMMERLRVSFITVSLVVSELVKATRCRLDFGSLH